MWWCRTSMPLPRPGSRSARPRLSRRGRRGAPVTPRRLRRSRFSRHSDCTWRLARKALCALRGMVKLQAMVRGQLVRRQANMTLRRMQALVAAQKRTSAERLRLLEDDKPLTRRSLEHHRSRKPLEAVGLGGEREDRGRGQVITAEVMRTARRARAGGAAAAATRRR